MNSSNQNESLNAFCRGFVVNHVGAERTSSGAWWPLLASGLERDCGVPREEQISTSQGPKMTHKAKAHSITSKEVFNNQSLILVGTCLATGDGI